MQMILVSPVHSPATDMSFWLDIKVRDWSSAVAKKYDGIHIFSYLVEGIKTSCELALSLCYI